MSEMFSTLSDSYELKSAVVRKLVQATVNGVAGVKTYPRSLSLDAYYYKGSISSRFISDKLKPDVSGVVIFDPDAVSAKYFSTTDMIDILDSTITGAVNNTGGYSTGVSTILVDGFTDSVYPIKKNDLFAIAGETGSTEHEVVSVIKTAGVTTSITFTPALSSNILNDAVITVLTTLARLSAVHGDNVAYQNYIIVVPTKEFT
jgi:hypothetical protein